LSVSVTFKGVTYTVPSPGGTDDWGASLTALLQALAANQTSVQVVATGTAAIAPLKLTPSAEPTGPNVVGQLYSTTAGVLKICTVAGTPGTWVSVGGQS
jgi:hypothetical protein